MAITNRPVNPAAVPSTPSKKAADEFIAAAPDAKRNRLMRGKKEQISLGIDPELLERVDASAARMGMTRAAWMAAAIFERLQRLKRDEG